MVKDPHQLSIDELVAAGIGAAKVVAETAARHRVSISGAAAKIVGEDEAPDQRPETSQRGVRSRRAS